MLLLHLRNDGSGEINESEVGAVSKHEKGLFSLPFRMIFLLPFPRYLFLAASYFFSPIIIIWCTFFCAGASERANMRDGWKEHNGRPCVSLFLSLSRPYYITAWIEAEAIEEATIGTLTEERISFTHSIKVVCSRNFSRVGRSGMSENRKIKYLRISSSLSKYTQLFCSIFEKCFCRHTQMLSLKRLLMYSRHNRWERS